MLSRQLSTKSALSRLCRRPLSSGSDSSNPTLYMWGSDSQGSLLKPIDRREQKVIDIPQPISDWRERLGVDTNVSIRQVVCGPTDTAWILSDSSLRVAGENKQGQLGVGNKQPVTQPTELVLPTESSEDHVASLSLGSMTAAFVDTRGDLYTCGLGGSTFSGLGALGHGSDTSYDVPQVVASLIEDGCEVNQVQCGESHTTVLTTEGEVLCCGAGSYGRLGNMSSIDQLYFEPLEVLSSGVTDIVGGKSFTLALKDNVLYGWGKNNKGQLGTGLGLAVDMYAMQDFPEPIETDELVGRKVTKVAAGASHAACITEGGEMFLWGMSLHLEPVRINDLLHTQIVDIACGLDYTLALDYEGQLYSFGKGKTGVLGQGSVKNLNQAHLMETFKDKKVVQVSAGWKHAACLVEEG